MAGVMNLVQMSLSDRDFLFIIAINIGVPKEQMALKLPLKA